MNGSDELLNTIVEDNALDILSEDNLVERLNFLLEHELITVTSDKIRLTDRGREAKNDGVEHVINRHKSREQSHNSPQKRRRKSGNRWKKILGNLKLPQNKRRKSE